MLDFLKIFDKNIIPGFIAIIIGSFISGILELLGIMLILPFIQVTMDPSSVANSRALLYIYNILGLTEYKSMIYIVGILCGFAFIAKDCYMLLFQNYQFNLVTRWRNELSEKFMRMYLGLNYRYHLRQASSAIINTLTSTVSASINGFLLQMLFIVSYSIVGLCLLGYMLLNYLLVTVVTFGVLIAIILFQIKLLKKASQKINEETVKNKEENLINLKQGIEAIKETKMFLRENFYQQLFLKSNRRVTDTERRSNLIQYIPLYLTEIIIIFCIVILVCMMAYFQTESGQVFSGLAVLIAITFRLTPVINRILTSYSQVRVSTQAVSMLINEYNELSLQQDSMDSNFSGSPLRIQDKIELSGVYFAYNNVDVLHNVSFSIYKGEFVGIVGHSGSGKTTIVDILMGLLRPNAGQFLLDGTPVTESMIRDLRRSIGYVPQNPFISDTSVRNNIAYGDSPENIDDSKIIDALKTVDLYDFFMEKEDKLNFKLGENGKVLSGGQRQRVAIARALYNSPEIIVFDEATSALDVKSESEISKAITKLKGKTTIIAIAHRLSTLKNADRIILVNRGVISDTGKFSELVNNNAEFAKLVELSQI
ncbi:TPA: ABC transporter ATP-binding protein [Yersinia enterocolitica]|nr:ABC transporter ATP-binding protein [Yersinia enterocolitica]HDL7378416.1 ABC transporter ATP-binding protein [Yersinia enterocolitica]